MVPHHLCFIDITDALLSPVEPLIKFNQLVIRKSKFTFTAGSRFEWGIDAKWWFEVQVEVESIVK